MNEYFIGNLLFDTIGSLDNVSKLGTCVLIITRLGVNNINKSSALVNGLVICGIVFFEFLVAGEVFDIKLDVRIIIDFMVIDVGGWGKEESLMRRHLLEDDFLDASFA